ncbi:MAG: hypothetical protein GY752_06480 [bacterium]|nr:hypothetical protein [bacterium]MCP4800731.1 hypothetical protein [bacterium]
MGIKNYLNFECIEPELGQELWQYDCPEVDPDLKTKLGNHLTLCQKCNQIRELDSVLASGLSNGTLQIKKPVYASPVKRYATRFVASMGTMAIAAGLVLMFMLPIQENANQVDRGLDKSGFFMPVDSEVITGGKVNLAWAPVKRATGYLLRLESAEGDWQHSVKTDKNRIMIPHLPAESNITAYLKSIPGDLSPIGGWSISFRHGSFSEFAQFRVKNSAVFARILIVFGLFSAGSLFLLRWKKANS